MFQSGDRIALGFEFVADVEIVTGLRNGAADPGIVELLRVVQIVASRIAGGVEVADPADVFTEGPDHVAFHDLHVVDVVQEFDARAVHLLTDCHAPCRVIILIAGMIHLGIEEFHVQINPFFLSVRRHSPKSGHHCVHRVGITLLGMPIPAEADQPRDPVLNRHVNRGF